MNDLMTKSFLNYDGLKKEAQIVIKSEPNDIENCIDQPQIIPADEANLSQFFEEVDSIKSNMEEITNLLFDLQTLNHETKSTHSVKILRGLRDRMESDMVSVLRIANVVRTRLELLDNLNQKFFVEGTAVNRTRVSVVNGLRIKLKEMMNDFQSLREKIVFDHKDYIKRRFYNIKGEYPSDEMIETLVSGCGKLLVEGNFEFLMENQERHEAVMDIERSLNKLHQVFLDMAVMVDAQGEKLDDIEGNVNKAQSFVNGGTNSLFYAKQMKNKNSKKWVFLIWAVLIIIFLVCFIAMLSSF